MIMLQWACVSTDPKGTYPDTHVGKKPLNQTAAPLLLPGDMKFEQLKCAMQSIKLNLTTTPLVFVIVSHP